MESENKMGSAIVITVRNKTDVLTFCAKGLRFGRAPKVVEKYLGARPRSLFMTCSGIGQDQTWGSR